MRIEVTQEDINEGIRDDCYSCPVALAIQKATRRDLRAGSFLVFNNYGIVLCSLPLEVAKWIYNFDRYSEDYGTEPQPISFDLDLPN